MITIRRFFCTILTQYKGGMAMQRTPFRHEPLRSRTNMSAAPIGPGTISSEPCVKVK